MIPELEVTIVVAAAFALGWWFGNYRWEHAIRTLHVHRWTPLKWGADANLDCRECRLCGRFEVYAYGSYRRRDRAEFPDARPAP